MTKKSTVAAGDISTATGLRLELAKLYAELKAGEVEDGAAAELANIAGKMISTAKTQVAYYALRKDIPNIKFLRDDSDGLPA